MDYLEVVITCGVEASEILSAELGELGVEAIEDVDGGLKAYFPEASFDQQGLVALQKRYHNIFPFTFNISRIERQNWNALWESNFTPVEVGSCRVRATFHEPDSSFTYDLVIEPKMSFGTGHHATTALMIAQLLELDLKEKSVLDCGYGTGILAILSVKLGGSDVEGVEIDEWCLENANENQQLNGIDTIKFRLGTITTADQGPFDVILANINKNVLLGELPDYDRRLRQGGILLLSGFYEDDLQDICKKCESLGLDLSEFKSKDSWVSARFVKK